MGLRYSVYSLPSNAEHRSDLLGTDERFCQTTIRLLLSIVNSNRDFLRKGAAMWAVSACTDN
jgi:hypothetical protein